MYVNVNWIELNKLKIQKIQNYQCKNNEKKKLQINCKHVILN